MKRFSCLFFIVLFSCSKPNLKKKLIKENILYDKAFEFREQGRIDSAFSYFNQAKDLFLTQKDSLGAGKCLVNMGIISTDRGDYFGGQEISLSATKYLDHTNKKQYPYIHSNYNNIGIASAKLADYPNALKFYNLAINYAHKPFDINLYLNNKAKVYQDTKNFNESLKIYNQILSKNIDNPKEYARALSNLAKTKWLIDPNYNAEPEFLNALNIRLKVKDFWGLNASYAHLSDFYSVEKPKLALEYAEKMYKVAKKIKSPDDQLEALQKLIKLSPAKETKKNFGIYEKLNDSLQNARSAAKNQFALIRYETEKSKADNLVLQKDNDGKRYQIIILLIGILLLIIVGILWYKKRKQRLELEAQNTIRENKLKTSQKVHDVVANGLYRIMSKLDNQETLKNNPIINEIEELYEQSRDLSYEKPQSKNYDFHQKIFDLLKSFASENTRVLLVGNSNQLWEKVPQQTKEEIQHILQEFMVNMSKHSQASDVVIKFEQMEQKINIYYSDNGIGISGAVKANNGLTNTGSRIAAIGGTIIFDTKVEKGLKIQVSFPVS